MSLTKEMIISINEEIERLDNNQLITYHNTHRRLNDQYPCSFYQYKERAAFITIIERGLEEEAGLCPPLMK